MPTESDEVVNVATPPERFTTPIDALPSRKVTVPVGVPADCGLPATAAVNVTTMPKLEGLSEEVRVVVLPALDTTCDKGDEVLVKKLASPP